MAQTRSPVDVVLTQIRENRGITPMFGPLLLDFYSSHMAAFDASEPPLWISASTAHLRVLVEKRAGYGQTRQVWQPRLNLDGIGDILDPHPSYPTWPFGPRTHVAGTLLSAPHANSLTHPNPHPKPRPQSSPQPSSSPQPCSQFLELDALLAACNGKTAAADLHMHARATPAGSAGSDVGGRHRYGILRAI